jgi:hypothetical protein
LNCLRRYIFPVFLVLISSGEICIAGGSAENVALIVNQDSSDSLTIANHYIHLRDIPAGNVIYLTGIPEREFMSIDECRSIILAPIFEQLRLRKIMGQIDYVVYSSDFPTAVRLPADANKTVKPAELTKYFRPVASLNAVTFFAQLVFKEDYTFIHPDANFYYRNSVDEVLSNYYSGEAKMLYQQLVDHYQNKNYSAALAIASRLAKSTHPRPVMEYWSARCSAMLGKPEDAVSHLATAVKMGWSLAKSTRSDPAFLFIARDSQFVGLVDQMLEQQTTHLPTIGFKGGYVWRPNGLRTTNPSEGRRFLLSVMLGCTRGKGNSVKEVVAALARSVGADASHPEGTFYFVSNSQIRSKTRVPLMEEAVKALQATGFKAELISESMPKAKKDILGAMTGVASFRFSETNSTILPGAICENLTSYGGVMTGKPGQGQTTVAEFIRYGAAGSSGTVVEPFTIPHKFPHPLIHLHYSRGCNLAEAFYQSVRGPYQLLIVGDPLCRPFAKLPTFDVQGVKDQMILQGSIKISATAGANSPVGIFGYDLYFRGKKVTTMMPGDSAKFDSTTVADGHYEFRVVAITDDPIANRTSRSFRVLVKNGNSLFNNDFLHHELQKKNYIANEKIEFLIPDGGDTELVVWNNSREVGRSDASGKLFVNCQLLGTGPVRLNWIGTKNNRSITGQNFFVNISAADQANVDQ